MAEFSANLGFLFTEYELPEAIRQAHSCGFAAVEFHWPYDTPSDEVRAALLETGLHAISLNTMKGKTMGLCAQPEHIAEAQKSIEQAFAYGAEIGAQAVHIMAGTGDGTRAQDCFIDNLLFASTIAQSCDMSIVIEALNHKDAPGYFLRNTDHVAQILTHIDSPHCKMMFDCYHVAVSGGDILTEFHTHLDIIGHVQFAGTPDRGAPDSEHNQTDYHAIFTAMEQAGWSAPFGAEYRPNGATKASLGWLEPLSNL